MGDFAPSQAELGFIYNSLQQALATNPRLSTTVSEINYGIRRVFRTYVLSDTDARLVLNNDDYDKIQVDTRTSPGNILDPSWVRVDLMNSTDDNPNHQLSIQIDSRPSYKPELESQPEYEIWKMLPAFDTAVEVDPVDDTAIYVDEELVSYFEEQVYSATPDDMATLYRIVRILMQS